jgi:NAD+ kinase
MARDRARPVTTVRGVPLEPCVLVLKRAVLHRGGRAARMARAGHATARRILPAAEEQARTVAAIEEALRSRGIGFEKVPVDAIDGPVRRRLARARLVVTVGGDGTLLAASHPVTDAAVLGVNASPGDSVGHFCATDRRGFASWLRSIEEGDRRPVAVARLAVTLDGRVLPEVALNDVLIAHDHPAATSRYRLTVAGRVEEHRSSGLWIAAAAGSTAGIRSAGGRPMPLRSRRIQFRVRELYREPGRRYRLAAGFVGPSGSVVVESKMDEGFLFIDGARSAYRFPFGSRVEVRIGLHPLRLFVRPGG